MTTAHARSLEEQRAEFARGRFLAMPVAGTLAWAAIGIASSECGAVGFREVALPNDKIRAIDVGVEIEVAWQGR